MGVNMLPRLAAMVISTTIRQVIKVMPAFLKIMIPNGTNVISATSLVMNMLLKKHRNTSVTEIPCRDLA